MTKSLVIGSNSFSGSSFVKYLLHQGIEVVGISRSSTPADPFLPFKWAPHDNFRFVCLDLNRDIEKITDLVRREKFGNVYNFAAQSMVGQSWENPKDWMMTNVVSTVELQNRLRNFDFLDVYLHITTPEVYGTVAGFVTEDTPFNPSTPYAVSRAAADMSVKTMFNAFEFPVISTRAANVFGPGQQLYRIIPRTILYALMGKKIELHGGGLSERSFIHIDDVSSATYQLAKEGKRGEVYHISTNEIVSIRELVEKIGEMLGVCFNDLVSVVDDRIGKDKSYVLSSEKIRSELGWTDQISLEQGLEQTVKWAKDNFDVLTRSEFDYIHKA